MSNKKLFYVDERTGKMMIDMVMVNRQMEEYERIKKIECLQQKQWNLQKEICFYKQECTENTDSILMQLGLDEINKIEIEIDKCVGKISNYLTNGDE